MLIVVLCLLLLLTGCAQETPVLDVVLQQVRIPVGCDRRVVLGLPADLKLQQTDNNFKWDYGDVTVMQLQQKKLVGKVDNLVTYTSTTVSRNFDDVTITIKCPEELTVNYRTYLNGAYLERYTPECPISQQLEAYPKYEPQDMSMNSNRLYMPDGCDTELFANLYTASVYYTNTDFVMAYTCKGDRQSIEDMICNIINSNSGKITSWYKDQDKFYATTDKFCGGYKQLSTNKWCVYIASIDCKDYVLQGIDKVVFKE